MLCQNCGSENSNEAKFCKNCGKVLTGKKSLSDRASEFIKTPTGKFTVGILVVFVVGGVVARGLSKSKQIETSAISASAQQEQQITDPLSEIVANPSDDNALAEQKNNKTKKSKSDSKNPDIYIDPGTGEKVVTIPGKTPENTNGHNITMLGFAHLVNDYGMTFEQVKKLQSEFEDYSSKKDASFHELSLTLKEIRTTVDSSNGTAELSIPIVLDRKEKEIAKVSYFGIDNPTLTIYNSDDVQVYSSK